MPALQAGRKQSSQFNDLPDKATGLGNELISVSGEQSSLSFAVVYWMLLNLHFPLQTKEERDSLRDAIVILEDTNKKIKPDCKRLTGVSDINQLFFAWSLSVDGFRRFRV